MRWFWLAVVLIACTKPNPQFCEANTDCANGMFCNVETHGCEQQLIDAATDGVTDGTPIDNASFVARTIAEIRAPSTPVDTPVELSGVVVTAVDEYGQRTGEFWIQTSGGGPGVKVYGALAADVATLSAGDVIDISAARKFRFVIGSDPTGRAEIQVIPAVGSSIGITKKGTTQTLVAIPVNAANIAALQQPQYDEAREALAGAYIVVTAQKAMGAPQQIGIDPTFLKFPIGPFDVESALAEFPPGIMNQTCFSSIRGVVMYALEYKLVPPRTSDLILGGTCP